MSCGICGSILWRNSTAGCEIHSYHNQCIHSDRAQSVVFDCVKCNLKLFPENWRNCRKCKAQVQVTPVVCKEFAGLCINCYMHKAKQDHLAQCSKCQNFLSNDAMRKCDFCFIFFEQFNLFQVPKCKKHLFCSDCLRKRLTVQQEFSFCKSCVGVFKRNNESSNWSKCNLCTETHSLISSEFCSDHQYCIDCLDFIRYNESTHFLGIKSCMRCKTFCEGMERLQAIGYEEESKVYSLGNATEFKERGFMCDSNHMYKDMSALDENLENTLNTSCTACIKIFLKLKILTKCIFCFRKNNIKIDALCTEFRNVCTDCFFPQIEISHVRTCTKCEVNMSEKIKGCDSCSILYERTELCKLPKCQKHRFCKSCIKDPQSELRHCIKCSEYFDSFRNRYRDICKLCRDPAVVYPSECKKHGYCNTCYVFIINEECIEFPSILKCENCKNHIKSMKVKSKFIECDNHHRYNKDDILKNVAIIESVKNCNSCVPLLLRLSGLTICIFCQADLQGDPNSRCHDYRNICETCYPSHVNPAHLHTCITCKTNYSKFLKICLYCHHYDLESNLFQVPRCKKHFFCEKCLSRPAPSHVHSCEKCISYFDNIGKKHDFSCNVCKLAPNKRICTVHQYCQICYDFILTKNYSHFPNVTNCQACMSEIEILKWQVISENPNNYPAMTHTPFLPPSITYGENPVIPISQNVIGYNPSSEHPANSPVNFPRQNPPAYNSGIPINYPHAPTVQTNYPYGVPYGHPDPPQVGHPQNVLSIPSNSVPQQFHPAPAVKHSNYPEPEPYPNNPEYFQKKQGNEPHYGPQGYNPHDNPGDFHHSPPVYLPDKTRYPEAELRSELTPAYAPVGSERDTGRNAGIIQYSGTRETESLEACCSNCRNRNRVCAFECNHNCCEECLVFDCSMSIYRFFSEYARDTSTMQRRFRYTCPIRGCGAQINVPTDMILKRLRIILERTDLVNQGRFMESLSALRVVAQYDMETWVPYFDGIKDFIVKRSCGNTR